MKEETKEERIEIREAGREREERKKRKEGGREKMG